MKHLFLLVAIILAPVSASAQAWPSGVTIPVFGVIYGFPTSAVNGGGTFTGQLFGPQSCTVPAYSFTTQTTSGYGGDGTSLCVVDDSTTIATFANPTGASLTSNYVNITRTIPNTSAQFNGIFMSLTEPPLGPANAVRAVKISIAPSAVAGTAPMIGLAVGVDSNTTDESAGIATGATNLTNPGTGKRYGGTFAADRGDTNIGSISYTYDFPNTYSIGAAGITESLGTNSIGVLALGGVDAHLAWTPPAVSAALVAQQVAAQPIFLGLDNTTEVFRIDDGGRATTTISGLATTSTTGYALTNTTAATGGATVQSSPMLTLQGTAWDTAASQTSAWHVRNLPATAATPTSTLQFLHSLNGAANTSPMTLTNAGNVTFLGYNEIGGASYYGWASRSLMRSPANGLWTVSNGAETFGIQVNTGTAAPTVGTCGTGTITDEAGTAGAARNSIGKVTATGATACTITFGSPAWTNPPTCVLTMRNIPITLIYISAVSTTAFTVSGLTANDVFSYKCEGRL